MYPLTSGALRLMLQTRAPIPSVCGDEQQLPAASHSAGGAHMGFCQGYEGRQRVAPESLTMQKQEELARRAKAFGNISVVQGAMVSTAYLQAALPRFKLVRTHGPLKPTHFTYCTFERM